MASKSFGANGYGCARSGGSGCNKGEGKDQERDTLTRCPCPACRSGEMPLPVRSTLWWCNSILPAPVAKGSLEELSCRQAFEDVVKLYSSFDEIIPLLAKEKNPAAQQILPGGSRIRLKTQQPLDAKHQLCINSGCWFTAAHSSVYLQIVCQIRNCLYHSTLPPRALPPLPRQHHAARSCCTLSSGAPVNLAFVLCTALKAYAVPKTSTQDTCAAPGMCAAQHPKCPQHPRYLWHP